jgi:hypothetical protein
LRLLEPWLSLVSLDLKPVTKATIRLGNQLGLVRGDTKAAPPVAAYSAAALEGLESRGLHKLLYMNSELFLVSERLRFLSSKSWHGLSLLE